MGQSQVLEYAVAMVFNGGNDRGGRLTVLGGPEQVGCTGILWRCLVLNSLSIMGGTRHCIFSGLWYYF